jgi:hypothetical protein
MKEDHFTTNNTAAYYKLIGLCVLCFFLIVILWITLVITTGWSIPYALLLAVAIPVAGYYVFRKRTTNTSTAALFQTHAEFKIKGITQKVMFTDIKSYSSDIMETEDKTIASLRIRLKDGKKMRYYATSDICDIEPLALLCRDFETLVNELGIKSKFISW